MTAALSFLFQINQPTPLKYAWVALTALNVALMGVLAWRERRSLFGGYMVVVALSSIFRASPLWNTGGDLILTAFACAFVWSLLAGGNRVFAVSMAVMLFGVLLVAAPMDWPGYSPTRYHARLYAAVGLLAASVMSVVDRWVQQEEADWRALIACAWFATLFLTLVEWRTDVDTKEYWQAYWRVALAGKIAAEGCLAGWIWKGREA